jgi:hypothetical protein
MNWFRGILFVCVLPALWIAGIGASLIDAAQLLVIFWEDRSGGDLISGCLLAGIALTGIVLWTWQIRRQVTDRGILRHCYWLLLAVLIAKIGWCCWLDSYQPNDMYRYWRYGQLLANGDNLISDWIITPGIFVRRAFFYTAPIIHFVGPELRHLEMVNVALQIATLWMLFLWGRSAIGLRATALAMPWYVLYPDWWFAPTLASHDIPAMLLVSCVLRAAEGIRCQLCRPQAQLTAAWGRLVLYSVIAGVCTAYLNMVRDFGPILLLTAVMGITFYFWGYGNLRALWANPHSVGSRESAVCQCLVLFCLIYVGTNRLLVMASDIPELRDSNSFGIGNLTTSVGTDGDGTFGHLAPWFLQYAPALPVSDKTEVFARKLLWEKLGKGLAFGAHVYRKKQVLASAARMMEYAFCGDGGSFTRAWDISRYAIGRNYCGLLYGVLSLLVLLRLSGVDRVPIHGGECMALILGLGLLVPLLLATESQNTYDQLLAIPMGAAVGVLTCGGVLSPNGASAGRSGRRLLVGATCLVILMGFQAAVGMLVNGLGLTFATFDRAKCLTGEFDVSPARLTVDLSKPANSTLGATALADIQFRLSGRSLEDGVLKFFLSSDHMNQKLMKAAPWGDCPWTWDLTIDGRVVLSGLVRELSSPKLKELRLTEQGRRFVQCRLVVRGDHQWAMRFVGTEDYEVVPQPRMAIEYCF